MKTTPTLTLLRDVEARVREMTQVARHDCVDVGSPYTPKEYREMARETIPSIQELIRRAGEVDETKVKWKYCPECGSDEFKIGHNASPNEHECKNCGQSWWPDVDYTDTVRSHLRDHNRPHLAPVASVKSVDFRGYWTGEVKTGKRIFYPTEIPVASGWMPTNDFPRSGGMDIVRSLLADNNLHFQGKNGDVYRVWLDAIGVPSIELLEANAPLPQPPKKD
jgi:hypothetical protein